MVERPEQYINKLKSSNLEISETAMRNLSNILGKDFWEPASASEIFRSQEWINSTTKHSLEKIFALVIAKAGGRYFVEWAKNKVGKIDGNDGFHNWQVGFFSLPESPMQSSTKVRTMIPNAEMNLSSPFDEKSFICDVNDERILDYPFVRFLRRSGFDGLNEVVFGVTRGEWDLVGARPYNLLELKGTRILWKLRDKPELGLDNNVKQVIEEYPIKVETYRPRPAIFGPLAAFQEEVGHMTRMAGDIAYWENASPMVDFRLFTQSILHRVVRGVGAK